MESESFTYTLTAEQREALGWALKDAYAYREREDEENDDFEEVDGPRRDAAEALYGLFGFNPDHIAS